MDSVRTGVFVFCALLAPVSCSDVFFTDPVICYFLDGFLMVYCIAATALFFREKFSKVPPVENVQEDNGGIYQELESPADVEYQVLNIQPPRGRKKMAKRNQTQQGDQEQDPYESLSPRAPAPPARPPN